MFVGRTDAKPEAPIVWLPDVKSWLIVKHTDAGKDRGQEEKGMTENEMIGWLHLLNGYEFEQTLRDSGQESLVHGVTKSWTQLSHWTTKEQLSKVSVLCQNWTYSLGENKHFILKDKMAILPEISRVAGDKCWLSLPSPLLTLIIIPFSLACAWNLSFFFPSILIILKNTYLEKVVTFLKTVFSFFSSWNVIILKGSQIEEVIIHSHPQLFHVK